MDDIIEAIRNRQVKRGYPIERTADDEMARDINTLLGLLVERQVTIDALRTMVKKLEWEARRQESNECPCD